MEQIIRQIYEQAQQLGVCPLFTGRERTVEDIVALFLNPQGMEFCMKHRFPNMATFRLFKAHHVERYGIYIDAGHITLTNPERAVLVGRTNAVVLCDTLARHEVMLLHNASATVNASGWAVVRTEMEAGCRIIRNTYDHAIIL